MLTDQTPAGRRRYGRRVLFVLSMALGLLALMTYCNYDPETGNIRTPIPVEHR